MHIFTALRSCSSGSGPHCAGHYKSKTCSSFVPCEQFMYFYLQQNLSAHRAFVYSLFQSIWFFSVSVLFLFFFFNEHPISFPHTTGVFLVVQEDPKLSQPGLYVVKSNSKDILFSESFHS